MTAELISKRRENGCFDRKWGDRKMELIDVMAARHSIRKYTGEHIADEKLQTILQAAEFVPRSRPEPSWKMIVVRQKETLRKMAGCRIGTGKMLENADCAIVLLGDPAVSDVWIEDTAIVISNMHLMASALGVGSCWIQGRLRRAEDGRTTEDFLREILDFPEDYRLEAILSLGMPAEKNIGSKI